MRPVLSAGVGLRCRVVCLLGPVLWVAGSIAPPGMPVTALAFSPDGRFLLSPAHRSISVRPVQGDGHARALPCDLQQVHDIAFSPDGRHLAVAGGTPGTSGEVRVLEWPGGAERLVLRDAGDLVTDVDFSPDGRQLVAASADRTVRLYPLANGSAGKPLELSGHAGAVLAAAFSPDGATLVTAGADRSVKAWGPGTGRLLFNFTNHTGIVHCLAFRPPVERTPAHAIPNWTWNSIDCRLSSDTPTHPHTHTPIRSRPVNSALIGYSVPPLHRPDAQPDTQSPGGRWRGAGGEDCASGSDDRTVRIWQPRIGRMVRIVRQHDGPVLAVAWSRDGSRLFSAGTEGVIRAIDGGSDRILHSWKAHDGWIYSLAVSPDGRFLASGDSTGAIRLWDAVTSMERKTGLPTR